MTQATLFETSATLIKLGLEKCPPIRRDAFLLLTEIRVPNIPGAPIFDGYAYPAFGMLHKSPLAFGVMTVGQGSWIGGNFRGTHGFEVKVSRSDFLSDRKMESYLPYCNYLWVVAPPGVVRAGDELLEGIGLIEWRPGNKRPLKLIEAEHRVIPEENIVEVYYSILKRIAGRPDSVRRVGKWPTDFKNDESFQLRRTAYDLAICRQELKRMSRQLKETDRAE